MKDLKVELYVNVTGSAPTQFMTIGELSNFLQQCIDHGLRNNESNPRVFNWVKIQKVEYI